jgi:hypothetical protein
MFNGEVTGLGFRRSSEATHSRPTYQPAMVSLETRVVLSGMGACPTATTAPANAAVATEIVNGLIAQTANNVNRLVAFGLMATPSWQPGVTQGTVGSVLRNEAQIRKLVASVEHRVSTSDPDYAEFQSMDTYFHQMDNYLVQVATLASNSLRRGPL